MRFRILIIFVIFALLFIPSFSVTAFADDYEIPQEDQTDDTAAVEPDTVSSGMQEPEETPDDALLFPDEERGAESAADEPDTEDETPDSVPEQGIILNDKRIRDPVYTVLKNGETIYLSIGEKELREFVDFFRNEMGLNSAAVAGILANLQYESEFDPNKIGDYGYAYGLCQWRGPRLDAMMKFCDEKGLNPVTIEGQLNFLKEEFENSHKYAGDLVIDTPDTLQGALQATQFFCCYYEVPSDPDKVLPDREKIAKELIYPLLVEWESGQ